MLQAELSEYLGHLRAGGSPEEFTPETGLFVEKEKVAAGGDYNLSGERYRISSVISHVWPLVPVGQVFDKSSQTVHPNALKAPIHYVGLDNISQHTGDLDRPKR